MEQIPSIAHVNFFRGFGIYTAGPFAARLLGPNLPPAIISRDILDRSGECIIAAGVRFDAPVLGRLRDRHLKYPFDTCIILQIPITPAELEWDFLQFFQQDAVIGGFFDGTMTGDTLTALCDQLSRRPLLLQKLTVMKLAEPSLYARSLLAAGLSFALCRSMRLPAVDAETTFIAALYHLMGLLHLNPKLVESGESLGAVESLQFHTHIRITHALMALEGASTPALLELVADSHERCDGTGFPGGKLESEIVYLAQILGLASDVANVYLRRVKPQARGWRDVIGIIGLSRQAYLFRAVDALNTLLAKSELPPANVVSGVDYFGFKTDLLARRTTLSQWFEGLRINLLPIGFIHGDRHLHALQNSVLQIAIAYKILLDANIPADGDESSDRALIQVASNQKCEVFDNCSLEQLHLMAQEFEQHLRRLSQMLERYILEHPQVDGNTKAALNRALAHAVRFANR